jgi:type II secretory pathway component PulF
MSTWKKALLIQLWIFIGFPLLNWLLVAVLGFAGLFIGLFLFWLWVWQFFAFNHYRFCRQEEFVHLLRTATATQAPVESVLRAYLLDRPREHLYRAILLSFVFPGYYWIHAQRSFDVRLTRLAEMLDGGVPIDKALSRVPGVVPGEVALAVAVGQYTGKLDDSLKRLSKRREGPLWAEWLRLAYPALVLLAMVNIMAFIMVFIIPKFERIFLEFKLKLPYMTEVLIAISRWSSKYWYVETIWWLAALALFNALLISSRAKWYFPGIGWIYRMNQRGRFLQVLGTMLESGKPVPSILEYVAESDFLPTAMKGRVERLALDLVEGEPLPDSLVRHGLLPAYMKGLVSSAEKARNLPWALQELGDSLIRRGARVSYRWSVIAFPVVVCVCSCIVGFVAYSMFLPLVELIDQVHDMR